LIPVAITTEVQGLSALSIRNARAIQRAAWKALGLHWQRRFLPVHFKRGAAQRYKYQRRRPGYQRRKRYYGRVGRDDQGQSVVKRGRVDLVYSGTFERLVTRPQIVRGYPSRCTIRIAGPRHVTMRPKDPRKPHMAAEALEVHRNEQRVLTERMAERMMRAIDRAPKRKTTMVRP